MLRRLPGSTLFPYTTLFRSLSADRCESRAGKSRRGPARPVGSQQHHQGGADREGSRRWPVRSEEHTSELQSLTNLVCRLLLEKKNTNTLRCNCCTNSDLHSS